MTKKLTPVEADRILANIPSRLGSWLRTAETDDVAELIQDVVNVMNSGFVSSKDRPTWMKLHNTKVLAGVEMENRTKRRQNGEE
jgi:hypothetical protein